MRHGVVWRRATRSADCSLARCFAQSAAMTQLFGSLSSWTRRDPLTHCVSFLGLQCSRMEFRRWSTLAESSGACPVLFQPVPCFEFLGFWLWRTKGTVFSMPKPQSGRVWKPIFAEDVLPGITLCAAMFCPLFLVQIRHLAIALGRFKLVVASSKRHHEAL